MMLTVFSVVKLMHITLKLVILISLLSPHHITMMIVRTIMMLFRLIPKPPFALLYIFWGGDFMAEPTKETSNPVEKEVKSAFKRSGRSSWIGCMLYPDNFYHCEFLEYLKQMGITHIYIKHQPEEDEKKEHIHLMCHFDYPYTVSGFLKSVGTGFFVETGKDEKGKPIYKPIRKEERELYSNSVELNIIGHAENITSPQGNYIYYLHKDFKSRFKIQYKDSDVQKFGDMGIINKVTRISYVEREVMYQEIASYACQSDSSCDFMRRVMADCRTDIVDYVSSHAYFIKEFFIK